MNDDDDAFMRVFCYSEGKCSMSMDACTEK